MVIALHSIVTCGYAYLVLYKVNRPLNGFDLEGSWRFVDRSFPEEYGAAKESLLAHLTPDKPLAEVEKMSLEEREGYESTVEACNWLKRLINDVDSQIGKWHNNKN